MHSVGWGAWAGGGMAAQDPALLARLRRQGFGAVPPHEGLRILASLLSLGAAPRTVADAGPSAQPAPALVASPLVWSDVLRAGTGRRAWDGFYEDFILQEEAAHSQQAAIGSAASVGPSSASAAPQRPPSETVLAAVLAILRQVLGMEVAPDQGLMEVRLINQTIVTTRRGAM